MTRHPWIGLSLAIFICSLSAVQAQRGQPAKEETPAANGQLGPPIDTGKITITSAALSANGRLMLLGGKDGSVVLLDLDKPEDRRPLAALVGEITAVAFSGDGRRAAVGNKEGALTIWDIDSGKERARLPGHRDPILAAAFSADGKRVVTGAGGVDDTVRFWDIDRGRELSQSRFAKKANIYAMAFAPDLRWVLTGHASDVKLWDAATGKDVATFDGHTTRVTSVAFSRDGRVGVSGSRDKTARVWDLAAQRERRVLEGHKGYVTCVAIAPDGKRVLTGSADRSVQLWDITSGKSLAKFEGHGDDVTAVAFTPDGQKAVSGSADKMVRVWKLPR